METTVSEILKFMGVLILITRCEFSSRRDLWKQSSDEIVKVSSKTTNVKEEWKPVEEVLCAINRSREERMVPCEFISVDESTSRWYGLGGNWCREGLPHYVAIDWKPENGCEIKQAAVEDLELCYDWNS